MNKKWIRISIGIFFLILLIVSFVPRLYLSNSSDGVVNARTVTLRSPIQGVVKFDAPVRHGTFFKEGTLIGSVSNDRLNSSFYHELLTEKMTLESRVGIMKDRIQKYQALNQHLAENSERYRRFSTIQLESMLRQNAARLIQERAEYARSKSEFDSNASLLRQNAIKRREYENSEAMFRKSDARIAELEDRKVELQNSLDAVKSGIFLGDGHNDVPYSSQRQDQLVIEIALAEAVIRESEKRLTGIEKQLAMEKTRLDRQERYNIIAPFNCLVWRLPVTSGDNVVINSELLVLLECRTIFLDVAIPERMFSKVFPGDKVSCRLIGNERWFDGTVIALRGSGAEETSYELAAKLTKDPKREFRVWIRADQKDLEVTADNFYKTGQRVEVKFPRRINPIQEVVRFLNVF